MSNATHRASREKRRLLKWLVRSVEYMAMVPTVALGIVGFLVAVGRICYGYIIIALEAIVRWPATEKRRPD